ncbi:hypothetical protein [Sulfurirhabdus autotrophica]|uniref:Uncharacterized protein n=1 Tax=Sulfurirhabdus autotrophica TaxID=1706046 RepID=A0A4R3Y292_9PROT|nr:hypothetical protein [Sulfurirhabdus autotrophica]TCV85810.1 hypothetical protein EDC63_10818 [Sulfurirhabdus autotrophica]
MINSALAFNPNKLLLDEPPIAVSPSLCRLFDLSVAVFLQQLNYRCFSNFDHPGKWCVIEVQGQRWVSWTPEGLLEDVPLGKSLAAHKRVISELKKKKIIQVAQLRKKYYDRSNFYSINLEIFQQFIAENQENLSDSTIPSIPDSRERGYSQPDQTNNMSSTTGESGSLPMIEENNKERDSSLPPLKESLESLIGHGPNDNKEWDKRRVISIINMVEEGLLGSNDLKTIIDDPSIRYLSEVDKRARLKVEENQKLQKKVASESSQRIEHEKKKAEASEQEIFRKSCSSWLEQADQTQLAELKNVAQGVGLASVNNKIRESVISSIAGRILGTGTTEVTIRQALRQLGYV